MNFVFWQNMVSIHQSALMSALSSKHNVTLVVEKIFEQERVSSGWGVPQMGATSIIEAPTEQEIDELLSSKDNRIHIFTGMRAYPMVTRAFKLAIKRRLRIGLYMEPYDPTGWRGILRKCVYRFLTWRYKNAISFVLATGNTGVQCYIDAGFSPQQVFEWGYFTEDNDNARVEERRDSKVKLLFVGRLDENKQILSLIESFNCFCSNVAELTIIGTGPLQKIVEEKVKNNTSLHYIGVQNNNRVKDIMSDSDLVILPSLYDGWGAVVNEALQSGCRVLCSTACGAASLLGDEMRGGTFNWRKDEDLKEKLIYWIRKGKLDNESRTKISSWARQNISGESAVDYLENIVQFCKNKRLTTKPVTPWKND